MEEIWKPIKRYEGLYEVSNLGRVRSLTRSVRHTDHSTKVMQGQPLKPYLQPDGYRVVYLWKKAKKKMHRINRLVAQAFIPNPNNLPQVNHKDEKKENDFVFINPDGTVDYEKSNLEWCTAQYNNTYGSAIIKRAQKRGHKVRCIETGQVFYSGGEAARQMHIQQRNINAVVNGKRNIAGGYHWERVE